MQETLNAKFEALKQAVIDVNKETENIIAPAPQDVIALIAPNIETAEAMAELYE